MCLMPTESSLSAVVFVPFLIEFIAEERVLLFMPCNASCPRTARRNRFLPL